MQTIIKGKVHIFGDNIDTDQIYPGRYLEITEHEEIGKHAMEGADEKFIKVFEKGGIIIAGENFGCGSSREHAVISLKNAGVAAVVARSFARIFYRNAINLGFPVISCDEILTLVKKEDTISIDFENGLLTNTNTGKTVSGDKLSDHVINIISNGGVIPMLKQRIIN